MGRDVAYTPFGTWRNHQSNAQNRFLKFLLVVILLGAVTFYVGFPDSKQDTPKPDARQYHVEEISKHTFSDTEAEQPKVRDLTKEEDTIVISTSLSPVESAVFNNSVLPSGPDLDDENYKEKLAKLEEEERKIVESEEQEAQSKEEKYQGEHEGTPVVTTVGTAEGADENKEGKVPESDPGKVEVETGIEVTTEEITSTLKTDDKYENQGEETTSKASEESTASSIGVEALNEGVTETSKDKEKEDVVEEETTQASDISSTTAEVSKSENGSEMTHKDMEFSHEIVESSNVAKEESKEEETTQTSDESTTSSTGESVNSENGSEVTEATSSEESVTVSSGASQEHFGAEETTTTSNLDGLTEGTDTDEFSAILNKAKNQSENEKSADESTTTIITESSRDEGGSEVTEHSADEVVPTSNAENETSEGEDPTKSSDDSASLKNDEQTSEPSTQDTSSITPEEIRVKMADQEFEHPVENFTTTDDTNTPDQTTSVSTESDCVLEDWNNVTLDEIPHQSVFKQWLANKNSESRELTQEKPKIMGAFVYKNYIAVTLSAKNFSSETVYCRYFDCNKKEMVRQMSSLVFPESTVYCPRRSGAKYISISESLEETVQTPVRILKRLAPKHFFTVCVTLENQEENILKIAQFIEYYKLQGSTFFFVYSKNTSHFESMLLDEYNKTGGEVKVIKVADNATDQVQANDCLHRNKHFSKWTAFLKLVDQLETRQDKETISAFLDSIVEHKTNILKWSSSESNSEVKLLVRPERIVSINDHPISVYLGDQLEENSESSGILKKFSTSSSMIPENFVENVDDSVPFRKELIENVISRTSNVYKTIEEDKKKMEVTRSSELKQEMASSAPEAVFF